jgi:hypothetical protein
MSDVSSNVAHDGASVNQVREDPLIRACKDFWSLEKLRQKYVSGEGATKVVWVALEEFTVLQGRMTVVLNDIRQVHPKNSEGLSAKYKVLKYQAGVLDFQDPDIFRDVVALLDEYDNRLHLGGSVDTQKPRKTSENKRRRRFNLQNILGVFNS